MKVNDVNLTSKDVTLTQALETIHTTLRFTDVDKPSKIGVALSGTNRMSDNYWRIGSGTHEDFYDMVKDLYETLNGTLGWPKALKIPKRFIKKWELN